MTLNSKDLIILFPVSVIYLEVGEVSNVLKVIKNGKVEAIGIN